MKPSCVPFSGEIRGRTAVIIPIPINGIEAISRTTSAARKFAPPTSMSKKSATTPNSVPMRPGFTPSAWSCSAITGSSIDSVAPAMITP